MITQERIKELLHYAPETGVFTWMNPTSVRVKKGDVAGHERVCDSGKTYRVIGLDGVIYQAHRVAWIYVHGRFSNDEIDHIDGDGSNNRIENLRNVSRLENAKNARKFCTNTSGICGVSLCKQTGLWRAMIWVDGGQRHIRRCKDKFEAICARKSAENKYGYHPNHGQDRPL